jgi:hypothetical protein
MWSKRLLMSLRRSAGSGSAFQKRGKSPRISCARSRCGSAGWREALQLFLEGLAAHDVAGLGEVAEDVEVLEAVELDQEFAAPVSVFAWVLLCPGADRVEHELTELGVGLEGVQPGDELLLQGLGLDHRLLAVAVVAAC